MRADIQALRGLAILAVVLYHADLGLFASGYLGVDIFFVISGYLITQLVARRLDTGNFSFLDFYANRAKRLLPAAYVVLAVSAALATWLLTTHEFNDFRHQLWGAVAFLANVVLWRQTGYFESVAGLKPLLHMWSLSLEEQYYLTVPALLWLTAVRWRLGIMLLILAISLTGCLALGAGHPAAAFYLLPFRAWELAIGSAGALVVQGPALRSIIQGLFWPALAVLATIPLLPATVGPPGAAVIAVTAATLIVILRQHPMFDTRCCWLPLTRLGDISYSLYLVHWPVLAFMANCWLLETPALARLSAALASVLLAIALYTTVEHPIHRMPLARARPLLVSAVPASLAIIVVSMLPFSNGNSGPDFERIARPNFGFHEKCDSPANFQPLRQCRNAENPKVLVWGDSYAMHLVHGLASTAPGLGILQATRSSCGPILDMAPQYIADQRYQRDWALECMTFNDAVMGYLSRTPSIDVVILSSPFVQYVKSEKWATVARTAAGFEMHAAAVETALEGMRHTVSALRALGKRVIVVGPPPGADFELGICLERRIRGMPSYGPSTSDGCRTRVASTMELRGTVYEFLDRLPQFADVKVVRIDELLREGDFFRNMVEGVILYHDKGHLSVDGSRKVAEMLDLASMAMSEAR